MVDRSKASDAVRRSVGRWVDPWRETKEKGALLVVDTFYGRVELIVVLRHNPHNGS